MLLLFVTTSISQIWRITPYRNSMTGVIPLLWSDIQWAVACLLQWTGIWKNSGKVWSVLVKCFTLIHRGLINRVATKNRPPNWTRSITNLTKDNRLLVCRRPAWVSAQLKNSIFKNWRSVVRFLASQLNLGRKGPKVLKELLRIVRTLQITSKCLVV